MPIKNQFTNLSVQTGFLVWIRDVPVPEGHALKVQGLLRCPTETRTPDYIPFCVHGKKSRRLLGLPTEQDRDGNPNPEGGMLLTIQGKLSSSPEGAFVVVDEVCELDDAEPEPEVTT
jgi:hypothetical protein